jgi:predicted acyltransferase
MALEDLTFGEFLFVVGLAAVASTAIFAHASKHGSKHATAWGVATFLAAAIAVPLYFLNYWLKRRRR